MATKKRIGEVLVSRDLISIASLEKALEAQKNGKTHRLLGHILVEMKALSYSSLLTALSEDLHIPRAEALLADRAALKAALGLSAAGSNNKIEPDNTTQIDSNTTKKDSMDAPEAPRKKPEEPKIKKATIKNVTFQLSKIELPLIELKDIRYLRESKGDIQQLVIMSIDMLKDQEFDEATLLIDEGLASDSSSLHLIWLKIWVLCAQKYMKKAEKLMATMNETDLQNPAFISIHSYILIDGGKFVEAIPKLTKITGLKDADNNWYFWLAYALAQTGHSAHATLNYKIYLKNTKSENKYSRFARKQIQELAS